MPKPGFEAFAFGDGVIKLIYSSHHVYESSRKNLQFISFRYRTFFYGNILAFSAAISLDLISFSYIENTPVSYIKGSHVS